MRPSRGALLAVVMALTSYTCGDGRPERGARTLPLFVPDRHFSDPAEAQPLAAPKPWQSHLKADDFEVDVLVDGAPLQKVNDPRGRIYLAGEPGREYTVRLRNRSEQDLNPVLWIDGINTSTLSFEDLSMSGWILYPGEEHVVQGYRLDSRSMGTFVFTAPEESFAQARGYRSRIGEIRVTVFQKRQVTFYRHRNLKSFGWHTDEPSGELGTGMGRRIDAPQGVGRDFVRDDSQPPLIITLYYDSKRNLCARGVQEFCR